MNVSQHGFLALALSLGGVVAAVVLEATILRGQPGVVAGYLIFVAFQIAAFALGVSARKDAAGKAACITSVVMACGSILLL